MRPFVMISALLLLVCLLLGRTVSASEWSDPEWRTDYSTAMSDAERDGRMMLIVFCARGDATQCDCLAPDVLANPEVRKRLEGFVRVRVPLEATISVSGKSIRLLDHPAFAEMLGRQGIAILDYAHKNTPYYGSVVSTFPVLNGTPYSTRKMLAILDLPPGTLTQRTLIYAVRTHPDRPASTDGQAQPELLREAENHSRLQALIRRQGHHQWGSRFPRIAAILPFGMTPAEVCAESWPGEGLLVAAIDCVHCWRQSSGHWRAVYSRQSYYGYDMKRGANGIWYATGIFGGRN